MPGFTLEDLDNYFVYHKPTPEALPKFKKIRAAGRELARTILMNCPQSADTTVAIRHVLSAVADANRSIAVNECPPAPDD